MYNLLMVGSSGYWEEREGCDFDAKRYLEHTVDVLRDRLRPLTPAVAEELKQWPVLFAYELPWHDIPSADLARVGRLTSIEDRGAHIRICYEFDRDVPPISASQLRSILWALDINKHESSRNHWAVKNIDLMKVLRKKGLLNGLPVPVAAPDLRASAQAVELALADADRMLADGLPSNALDRIHTVLHGHLVQICEDAGLVEGPTDRPNMTAAFSRLRKKHPAFVYTGPRGDLTEKAMNASATFLDAFNPLRNSASVAHPNEAVVPHAEAMYLINMARSLLHYVEMKRQG